ncbi:MAG: hypothetical protein CMI60_18570 [Parvibaculum sp.]|nr:hypothetical protein [Parvibaculum sp.]
MLLSVLDVRRGQDVADRGQGLNRAALPGGCVACGGWFLLSQLNQQGGGAERLGGARQAL